MVEIKTGLKFAIPSLFAIYLTRKFLIHFLPEKLLTIGEITITKDFFLMALFAIVIAISIGIILGIISALYKDTWIDRIIALLSTLGMSIPSFFSAILFAWFFGFLLHNYTGLNMTGSLYEVDDFGEGSYIQWKNITPDFVVDITGFEEKKIEAIMAYKTQFYDPNSKEPSTPITSKNFFESLNYRAQDLGRLVGKDFAEGFTVERCLAVNSLENLI